MIGKREPKLFNARGSRERSERKIFLGVGGEIGL